MTQDPSTDPKESEEAPRSSTAASAKAARKTAGKRARAAVPPPPGALKAKPAKAQDAETDDAAQDADTDDAGPELKKQELIAKVIERADIKKKYAKPVVEAVIEVLGEALAEGRELNLQPFGKLKLNRTKDTPNARVIVAKIRQAKSAPETGTSPKEPVADAAE